MVKECIRFIDVKTNQSNHDSQSEQWNNHVKNENSWLKPANRSKHVKTRDQMAFGFSLESDWLKKWRKLS